MGLSFHPSALPSKLARWAFPCFYLRRNKVIACVPACVETPQHSSSVLPQAHPCCGHRYISLFCWLTELPW